MKQYVATRIGGPFSLVTTSFPSPGPGEICIKNKALSLNPLDWKNLHYGEMVKKWPEVLGVDISGVVEAVGEDVEDLKPGDEVFSLAGHGGRAGAFQEITSVPRHFVARKPAHWSFEEACSIPICFLTAAAAIVCGLRIPLSRLQVEPAAATNMTSIPVLGSILVIGGSSGVGASSIQLLRLALPKAVILSTNSPQHNDRLMGLGATRCIDRNCSRITTAVKSASPGGKGVDAILDAVAGVIEEPAILSTLHENGPKLYSHVFTGSRVNVPTYVTETIIFGRMIFGVLGGLNIMEGVAKLAEEGGFTLPQRVEVIGKGFATIDDGLKRLKCGVSGSKLVVSL